jgi:hypothetical protein
MRKLTSVFIGILILTSCNYKRIDLYDGISVSIPASFKPDDTKVNSFVNTENKVCLKFTQTKNMSFGELMPKIDFDFLYNSLSQDRIFEVQDKEIRNISGLKVGVIEKSSDSIDMKMFFTEIRHEILMGVIWGDSSNGEYIESAFNEIMQSIKENN